MNIFISGSLAYDRIMDFRPFCRSYPSGNDTPAHVFFNINSLVEKFGGTAGNIA